MEFGGLQGPRFLTNANFHVKAEVDTIWWFLHELPVSLKTNRNEGDLRDYSKGIVMGLRKLAKNE